MLAARIPAGAVCGNKVPTVVFGGDDDESARLTSLWLAIVNSLPFDWLLRRVITTTVNFFILRAVPLPPVRPDSVLGRRLTSLASRLDDELVQPYDSERAWRIGDLRAEIDKLVLRAYGLEASDLHAMLDDFPLLDRHQPPLDFEERSTVTSDLLRVHLQGCGEYKDSLRLRLEMAREAGAVPFMPNEFATSLFALKSGRERLEPWQSLESS